MKLIDAKTGQELGDAKPGVRLEPGQMLMEPEREVWDAKRGKPVPKPKDLRHTLGYRHDLLAARVALQEAEIRKLQEALQALQKKLGV